MPRKIYGGAQDFAKLREGGYLYIDKTSFIREWWNGKVGVDDVTLITRPRRFGKTLMMSTVEQFFSMKHAGRADFFKGLDVWQDEALRAIQGTYPVISLTFADSKPVTFGEARADFLGMVRDCYAQWRQLIPEPDAAGRLLFEGVAGDMDDSTAKKAIRALMEVITRQYGKKVIVLLDEYDTPMQEAWLEGFWPEMVKFMRGFFNATFKTNPFMERALLTGVTRISKESLFSDFNNLRVVTTTTPQYETAFGFTEDEVFAVMDEYGLADREGVKAMYDGFTFGNTRDIYNPWSVTSYLKSAGLLDTWWANTSSNALAGKLVREGSVELKQDFMILLEGGSIRAEIDEQLVFDQLTDNPASVWSLLVASGYLKVVGKKGAEYELMLTNGEVTQTFEKLVKNWFRETSAYGNFLKALMQGDLKFMNRFMNDVALACFSSFDTGKRPGRAEPERFYHGFVLGLLVDLRDRYVITSNRESGFGRYDIVLEPRTPSEDDAFIFEFKVHDADDEADLQATVASALGQIAEKRYAQQLVERGIPADRIRSYGFAFRGKEVLIGSDTA